MSITGRELWLVDRRDGPGAAPGRARRLLAPRPARRADRVPAGALCAALALASCGRPAPMGADAIRVVGVVGETGTSPGQFIYPRAIAADDAALWIVDKTGRVQRIEPDTGDPIVAWKLADTALGKPTGLTVAPGPGGDPCLYIVETHYHRVSLHTLPITPPPDGPELPSPPEPMARFGSYGTGPGQFIYPTDAAVLPDAAGGAGRIYVSEYGGNDRVSVFDGRFEFLFSFGVLGYGDLPGTAEFQRPQSIAIDAARRELVVTDSSNHRLGRFTLEGDLIGWIGVAGSPSNAAGEFQYPFGLHLPGDGTALVVEQGNGRVQHIDLATGACLGLYGRPGREHGELFNPWSMTAIGDRGYVLDSGSNRVLAFRLPARRRTTGSAGGGWGGDPGRGAGG